jgi:uncharacterized LabA/DUF88 family protein
MINKFVKGKTAVFIDSANVYYSEKTMGWRIDFQKLLNYFKRETNLFRIAYYGAINPENKGEQKFHDFLEIIGYVVRHKKLNLLRIKRIWLMAATIKVTLMWI